MAGKRYYTKTEAAQILGVHKKTVERYLLSGKLMGARFGKEWRISEDDIQALYDAVKQETARRLTSQQNAETHV